MPLKFKELHDNKSKDSLYFYCSKVFFIFIQKILPSQIKIKGQ